MHGSPSLEHRLSMEHRGQSLHAAGKQSRDAGVGAEGMTLKMSLSKAELLDMWTEISVTRRLACEQRKKMVLL